MQRTIIIALSVLCVMLAILSGVLAYKLSSQPRFIVLSDKALYHMFDQKTAQACWAGPPSKYTIEPPPSAGYTVKPPSEDPFLKGLSKAPLPTNNDGGIPFCKDL
jgi:hypothetical protein